MIPQVYRRDRENVIASYDGINLATGKGLATYYLGKDTGDNYFLSSDTFYSDEGSLAGVSNSVETTNFDVIIGKPMIIEGNAIVMIPSLIGNIGSDQNIQTYIGVAHWDGASETILGSATKTDSLNNKFKMWTFQIDVSKQHFKIGETLRIILKTGSQQYQNHCTHHFDPMSLNTTATLLTTKATAKIPIKIDL